MSDDLVEVMPHEDVLRMAAGIVATYVGNNQIAVANVPSIISTVFRSLSSLGGAESGPVALQKPAVSVRRSVNHDYLICLEDGKRLKMLKRHLRTTYGLSLEEYRIKWKLPPDYPMVAPAYAKQRSDFAKKIGLGRQRTRKA